MTKKQVKDAMLENDKRYNVAVVGATGNVGRHILSILHERKFPVKNVYALASRRSKGKLLSFGDANLKVEALEDFDFSNTDIALFSPGSAVSSRFVPIAAKHAVVIDNTSYFRMDKDVPLVIPEVNSETLVNYSKRNIIANPNCAVLQLAVALKPLHDVAKIKRVVMTTFQSVSGAGKSAMDELFLQTKGRFVNDNLPPVLFPKKIAFNIIPHIGSFGKDGNTEEETKIVNEFGKIFDQNIPITATCVRVPVFVGHSESVNVEFENAISPAKARKILRKSKGVAVVDSSDLTPETGVSERYITPIECVGEDEVYVSRIRKDNSLKNGLTLWIVSDNLRKGAALNAVQIAEELIKRYVL